MNTVFLRLEGPLQSWGSRAHWEERDTNLEPTKSGVIGLIGAALGLPRTSPEVRQLSMGVQMGVRVDRQGERLIDYHTTGGGVYQRGEPPKRKPTHRDPYYGGVLSASTSKHGILVKYTSKTQRPEVDVSYRHYLMNASFLVAIQGSPEIIDGIAHALQAPVWPPFLGRKSCVPTCPIFVARGAYADVETALRDMDAAPLSDHADTWLRLIIEQPDGRGLQRRDAIENVHARRFKYRYVREDRIPRPGHLTGINTWEG